MGRRYFPHCSKVLDKLVEDDLPDLFYLETGTPEEQRIKTSRYKELKDDVHKAFSKDKAELHRSGFSSVSTPSTIRHTGNYKKPRKLWHYLLVCKISVELCIHFTQFWKWAGLGSACVIFSGERKLLQNVLCNKILYVVTRIWKRCNRLVTSFLSQQFQMKKQIVHMYCKGIHRLRSLFVSDVTISFDKT